MSGMGASLLVGGRPAVAQTAGASAEAESLPACSQGFFHNGWRINRSLAYSGNEKKPLYVDRISWELTRTETRLAPQIGDLELEVRWVEGEIRDAKLAISVDIDSEQMTEYPKAMSLGVSSLLIGARPLMAESVRSHLKFSGTIRGQQVALPWQAVSEITFSPGQAQTLWNGIDEGLVMLATLLVPRDESPHVGIVGAEVSFESLKGIQPILTSHGALLRQQLREQQCALPEQDCYLTTLCCDTIGLDDDCVELRSLRHFRDHWLVHQPGGAAEIAEYRRIGPGIVKMLKTHADRVRLVRGLYLRFILPSLALIWLGRREAAWRHYRRMVRYLLSLHHHENSRSAKAG